MFGPQALQSCARPPARCVVQIVADQGFGGRSLLKKAGAYLVPCGPIFGAKAIAERSALGDHTFSKGPHSGRHRFASLQEASHHSQLFENLGGVSIWFHDRILGRSPDGFHG